MGKTMKPDAELVELDSAVIQVAENILNEKEWLAFSYAYHCKPSWEEILFILHDEHGRTKLKQSSLERYGRCASAVIVTKLKLIQARMKNKV